MPKKLIGTESYQVPRNADLGTVAFQDAESVNITGGVISLGSSSTTGYFQDTAISDVKPSLILDFANTKTLDPRITFTRASTATYYDGKTLAKAEENLLIATSTLSNTTYWSRGNMSISDAAAIAPDGSLTASRFLPNTTSATHYCYNLYSSNGRPVVSGLVYTASVYLKADGYNYAYVSCNVRAGYTEGSACINLTNGTITDQSAGGTVTVTSVGNGWYRVVMTATASYSWGFVEVWPRPSNGTTGTYVGDGVSGILVWGPQLEQRSTATTYFPTTTSPITNYIPALQTANSHAPRLSHDPITGESKGVLVEESRTNLLINSSYYDGVSWNVNNVSVKNNATIAPDGTLTAMQVIVNTGTGRREFSRVHPGTAGTKYTYSVFAKKYKELDRIVFSDAGAGATACYNLTTGIVYRTGNGAEASITNVGNDWYRLTYTFTAVAGVIYMSFGAYDTSESVFNNTTGDGFGGPYLWGHQLEASPNGAIPTSYIPTTSTQVTRAADNLSLTGTNFSSWYNPLEGTIYTEAIPYYTLSSSSSDYNRLIWFRNSSTGNYGDVIQMSYQLNGAIRCTSNEGTVITNTVTSSNTITPNTTGKAAYSFKTDYCSVSLNGGNIVTDTAGRLPITINSVLIGSGPDSLWLNGTIGKIIYYPKQLSDAELQEMTL